MKFKKKLIKYGNSKAMIIPKFWIDFVVDGSKVENNETEVNVEINKDFNIIITP